MPAPVSETRTTACRLFESSDTETRPPGGVNFTALVSRLSNSRMRSSADPLTTTPGLRAALSRTLFSEADPSICWTTTVRSSPRSMLSASSRRIRPALDNASRSLQSLISLST